MKVTVTGDFVDGSESKIITVDLDDGATDIMDAIKGLLFTRDMLCVTITKTKVLKHVKRLNEGN